MGECVKFIGEVNLEAETAKFAQYDSYVSI